MKNMSNYLTTDHIRENVLLNESPKRKLPDIFMIWILPYDPFGDGRMIYTVKNMVVENNLQEMINYEKRDSHEAGYQAGLIEGIIRTHQLLNATCAQAKADIIKQLKGKARSTLAYENRTRCFYFYHGKNKQLLPVH